MIHTHTHERYIKGKIKKLDFIKIKMFALQRHCYENKMASQQTGEKKFSKHLSDK